MGLGADHREETTVLIGAADLKANRTATSMGVEKGARHCHGGYKVDTPDKLTQTQNHGVHEAPVKAAKPHSLARQGG